MDVYVAIIASFLKMKLTLVAGGVCFIFFLNMSCYEKVNC